MSRTNASSDVRSFRAYRDWNASIPFPRFTAQFPCSFLLAFLILPVLPHVGYADQVTFELIDDAFTALDMSPDGRFVVGSLLNGRSYLRDYSTGTVTTLPEGANAVAVSDDGQTVLGSNLPNPDGVNGTLAAIWKSSTNQWESLGYLPEALNCPSKSSGYELSADGTVATGLSWVGCSGRGFVWTEETGMVELEGLANGSNRASVISADGTVIGGFAQGSFSRTPSVWNGTSAVGELLDPPNGDALGEVHGIRDDGSLLLGTFVEQDDPTGAPKAMTWANQNGVWVREQIANGSFRPGWQGIPLDIADDGTIVGFDILPGSFVRRGWIVDPDDGSMTELNTFLLNNGVDTPIFQGSPLVLEVPQAITTNGRVIVGHGGIGTGAWRIVIRAECDFDSDLDCDIDDIDALTLAISSGSTEELYDLNGDGQIDTTDLNQWLVEAGEENIASGNPYILGDANLNGAVDVSDFNVWNSNKFSISGRWSQGDFNASGATDVSDFNIWNNNKFSSSDGSVVPEPTGFSLVMLGLLIAAARLRTSN